MDNIDSEGLQTHKMRLRPLSSISRDEMIQKNLVPLQENVSKKKRAQAHYYEQQTGCSPLLKDSAVKVPVHARLGLVYRNKRKVPVFGTNTTAILPRHKYNFNKDNNNRRMFSAQYRLHRIRQQNLNQEQILLHTPNSKRIQLQRTIPSFKIQVVNDAKQPEICERFQLRLNPIDQEAIRQIQISQPRQIIHGVYPIIPKATNLTLNERFSHLS